MVSNLRLSIAAKRACQSPSWLCYNRPLEVGRLPIKVIKEFTALTGSAGRKPGRLCVGWHNNVTKAGDDNGSVGDDGVLASLMVISSELSMLLAHERCSAIS